MRRRRFLESGLKAGALAGLATAIGPLASLAEAPPDLVAVRGGSPEQLFDAAIAELGGMRAFVRPGQKVVVKPNVAWDVPPERAANTNPRLVQRIVEQCREAGAGAVYVFDNTCDDWRRSYRTSGIEAAVRAAGGTMVPANSEGRYHPVQVGGRALEQASEHELVLEADVLINVPVLKSHGSAGITVAMKNLMGVVWDRSYWHGHDLHQCIADFATHRRPTLNVVDAYDVMVRHGPRGGSREDVARMGSLLLGRDLVMVDAAAARLFGLEPAAVRYIRLAAAQGAGSMDLGAAAIRRVQL